VESDPRSVVVPAGLAGEPDQAAGRGAGYLIIDHGVEANAPDLAADLEPCDEVAAVGIEVDRSLSDPAVGDELNEDVAILGLDDAANGDASALRVILVGVVEARGCLDFRRGGGGSDGGNRGGRDGGSASGA